MPLYQQEINLCGTGAFVPMIDRPLLTAPSARHQIPAASEIAFQDRNRPNCTK
jgi:hypothetical protein